MYEGVLNLLLTAERDSTEQLLVAMRRPGVNDRHPGVASLPTMRIPARMCTALNDVELTYEEDNFVYEHVSGPIAPIGTAGAGRVLTSFLAESLMSRKLGIADMLEERQITGSCALRLIGAGVVDDPTGTSSAEGTKMYTIAVRITRGWDLFPSESASYSGIRWVDKELFLTAWSRRDAQILFPLANPFELCIRGLCIRSAVELLSHVTMPAVLVGHAAPWGAPPRDGQTRKGCECRS